VTTWTPQHDIDLVVAYLGYEITTPSPHGVQYCLDGEGRHLRIPDMRDRSHGWLLDCLDSWLRVRRESRWARLEAERVDLWDTYYPAMPQGSGEGNNMHEALAWALWRASFNHAR